MTNNVTIEIDSFDNAILEEILSNFLPEDVISVVNQGSIHNDSDTFVITFSYVRRALEFLTMYFGCDMDASDYLQQFI